MKEIKREKEGMVKFLQVNYKTLKAGLMELSEEEFLRRFSLLILPSGFMKTGITDYSALVKKEQKRISGNSK